MLPPLAILIPRIIRILELLVELYGIFAPCVGCALRGCFGCGEGKKKKKPDDGCDCPCPPPPKEEQRKRCFLRRKSEGRVEDKVHREGCSVERREKEKKSRWWQCDKGEGKRLRKSSPPSSPRGFGRGERRGREEEEEQDAELQVLQRQYSSLPPPPPPPPPAVALAVQSE